MVTQNRLEWGAFDRSQADGAMVSRVQKHLNYHESVNDIMPFIDGIGRELNQLSGLNILVTGGFLQRRYMRFCKKDNVADFNSLSKVRSGHVGAR